jgi:hypothetical protein
VGELVFNPSSLDTALYLLFLDHYESRIDIDVDVNSYVNVVAVYSEVMLNQPYRRYLKEVNIIKPMYNLPVISYDTPPLYSGKVTEKVYNNTMTLPLGGTIYNIKVLGKHTIELQIGGQVIPVQVSFDGTSTCILDFTENQPILNGIRVFHEIQIISASTYKDKGLTVSFEVGKMPTDLDLSKSIDIQYNEYMLSYFEGRVKLTLRRA